MPGLQGVVLPAQDWPAETFPGYAAPIIVSAERPGSAEAGAPVCEVARYGLVPRWCKDGQQAATLSRHTYNARSETVAEKPSYRTAWRQRQFGLVLVDNFYEPSYESGKAVRWKIELASGDPFGIACLWDRWTDPASGERVVSFSMLTVNADDHPVMRQFHKPGDEKRTPVIIAPELQDAWLSADTSQASELMTWSHMPDLLALQAPLVSRRSSRSGLSQ